MDNNKRKALGMGLEQLFNNTTLDIENVEKEIIESTDINDIVEIKLADLRSNPYQPRQTFDEDKLKELSESIKEYGVIQPIIVKKSIKGYEIIAGERRKKASELAGLETIPAIIKDFSDAEMMEIALLENIQREDLSAIEEAEAYKNIIVKLQINQEELAKKIGKSRSYVTNMLGLLRLPAVVQEKIKSNTISMGHARALSKIEDLDLIVKYAKKIEEEGISVRKLEELVKNPEIKKVVPIKKTKERKYSNIENIMREKIGTMVKITNKKIEIPYDSEKDLERILDILKIDIDCE